MYVKLLRSCWDDFAICAGVLGGFFLATHIITAVVLAFFFDGTSLMISGMILPIVSAFLILIYSLSYSGFQFSHLVRFGCTRRRSLALTLGLEGTVTLFCMGLSALLIGLERLAAPILWQALSGCDGIDYARNGHVLVETHRSNALFIEIFSMPPCGGGSPSPWERWWRAPCAAPSSTASARRACGPCGRSGCRFASSPRFLTPIWITCLT